jgi:hypothetical protein
MGFVGPFLLGLAWDRRALDVVSNYAVIKTIFFDIK